MSVCTIYYRTNNLLSDSTTNMHTAGGSRSAERAASHETGETRGCLTVVVYDSDTAVSVQYFDTPTFKNNKESNPVEWAGPAYQHHLKT